MEKMRLVTTVSKDRRANLYRLTLQEKPMEPLRSKFLGNTLNGYTITVNGRLSKNIKAIETTRNFIIVEHLLNEAATYGMLMNVSCEPN